MQKNLLLLDDCFLGKQTKAEAYYTRGRHNNSDTIYIAQNYFQLPQLYYPVLTRHEESRTSMLTIVLVISLFKQFCHRVWSKKHNFSSQQQNYYLTKRCCTRKLQKVGMHNLIEVDREESNCIHLAQQFSHLMKEYRERFFTYVLCQSPTQSLAAHLESYLLHMYNTFSSP